MRGYILALLAALVLVIGALAMNQGATGPPSPPRDLPNLHELRLR